MSAPSFATRLVRWQRAHGRHDLPWQHTRDPYRVWLSEIMLQQTQVVTVMGYFERFLQRFPTVRDLAAASEDEVLGLWSGLGYYSRARNLHRAARQVVEQHGGVFPPRAEQLQTLPGIGRSTAAAVASVCFDERVAILDGNVKRVLSRHLGYDADLAQSRAVEALWARAHDLLPRRSQDMPVYTQAVMDLGATVCTPRQPRCDACPVRSDCVAHQQGTPERYPVRTRRLQRRSESWWLLLARTSDGRIWLTQRPASGIWARLYALPLFADLDSLCTALPSTHRDRLQAWPAFKHVLTHRDLYLHPMVLDVSRPLRGTDGIWARADEWAVLGLPAPVRTLLAQASQAADGSSSSR